MTRLKTGFIGLSDQGLGILQTARRSPFLDVCALADHRGRHDADDPRWDEACYHEDARSMILSSSLDLLLVALPPFQNQDYLRVAAGAKLATWQITPPFASTVAGREIIDAFRSANCPHAIDRFWEGEPAYEILARAEESIGEIRHCLITVCAPWLEDASRKGDFASAGGGMLLHAAYGLLDFLITSLGPVDQVFAATCELDVRQQAPELSCSAVLSHSRGFKVAVSCVQAAGHTPYQLSLFGSRGSIVADAAGVRLFGCDGTTTETFQRQCRADYLQSINCFAEAIANDQQPVPSLELDHLAVISTIEAAYLSMRTNQPESPIELRKVHESAH